MSLSSCSMSEITFSFRCIYLRKVQTLFNSLPCLQLHKRLQIQEAEYNPFY